VAEGGFRLKIATLVRWRRGREGAVEDRILTRFQTKTYPLMRGDAVLASIRKNTRMVREGSR